MEDRDFSDQLHEILPKAHREWLCFGRLADYSSGNIQRIQLQYLSDN